MSSDDKRADYLQGHALDRRHLLKLLASAWFGPSAVLAAASPDKAFYLSARTVEGTRHLCTGFSLVPSGRGFDVELPGRGHAVAVDARGEIGICIARRPGRFAVVIDLASGKKLGEFSTPQNRHFCGHGVFSRDGLFFATENDFDNQRGVVGVYALADGMRRIAELDSGGIGPHEIVQLSDGTLVVANGGIATHPDAPGIKLNLPTMAPSLCYLSARTGQLLERVRFNSDRSRLSIRHLDIGRDDLVVVGLQSEGHKPLGLVASHRRGHALRLLPAEPAVWKRMNGYCGSVCFDSSGRYVAASSPRGNTAVFWDTAGGEPLYIASITDGCGVAPTHSAGEFLLTNGVGEVASVSMAARPRLRELDLRHRSSAWDNHLTLATAGV